MACEGRVSTTTHTSIGRPDRPGHLVQMRGQSAADPIIVEQAGLDPERLTRRPSPGLFLHMHQRRGRGQPIGHQHLDHLPMRQLRHITHRTGRIHQFPDP